MIHLLGRLVIALAEIFQLLIGMYSFIVAASVIISWVGADPYNPIVRTLRQLTEPVFSKIRRWMPSFLFKSNLDFTPIIVLIFIILIREVVVGSLFELGQSLLK